MLPDISNYFTPGLVARITYKFVYFLHVDWPEWSMTAPPNGREVLMTNDFVNADPSPREP